MPNEKPTYLSALMTVFGLNWITMCGAALAGISAFLIVSLVLLGLLQLTDSPYIGILAFMVLPFVFIAGLLIVPVGAFWERKFGKAKTDAARPYPTLDFNDPHTRRVGALVAVITGFNLLIIGTVSYQGVQFMDSVTFCGRVCHTVMAPEYTAYSGSAHLRVACVECHIGPGAPWFVRAKISGMGQVLAVATHSYPKPIPSPVENLRPSRDTCEHCHWPEKFTGDRIKVVTHYQDDEANTPSTSVLSVHIGGGGTNKGIHSWHISQGKRTYYKAVDRQRQKISQVRVVQEDGAETVYRAAEGTFTPEELAGAKERMMDCIDCHNRPSHVFKLPVQEVEAALQAGRIDPTLPYIAMKGKEVLAEAKGTPDDLDEIAGKIRAYYEKDYPDLMAAERGKVDGAIAELQAIYRRNVFPDMNLTWGTHPNNLGHQLFPGCFRCHDSVLTDSTGKAVGQDCETCHKLLAWDEPNPTILETMGL